MRNLCIFACRALGQDPHTLQPRAEEQGEEERIGQDAETRSQGLPVGGDADTPTRLVGRALALLTGHLQAAEPALGLRGFCTWMTQLGSLWDLLLRSGGLRKSVHTVPACVWGLRDRAFSLHACWGGGQTEELGPTAKPSPPGEAPRFLEGQGSMRALSATLG